MSRTICTLLVLALFASPLFAESPAPDVRRPAALLGDAGTADEGAPIVVTAKGDIWYGGARRSWVGLERELATSPGKAFRIVADRRAPWRAVRHALVAAQEIGSVCLEVQGTRGKTRLWRPRLETGAQGLILEFRRDAKAMRVFTRHDDELGRVWPSGAEAELGAVIAEFVEFHELGGVVIMATGDPTFSDVARLAAACRSAKAGDLILFAGPHPLEYAADRPAPPAVGEVEAPAAVKRQTSSVRPAAAESIRRAVALPTVASPRVGFPVNEEIIEILVTKDRSIWAGGARHEGWGALATWLRPHAEARIEESPFVKGRRGSGPSLLPVILRADGSALWADIVAVLKACAHPSLRIVRLYFEVVDEEDEAVLVPMALVVERIRLGRQPIVVAIDKPKGELESFAVEMVRKRGADVTTIRMDGEASSAAQVEARIQALLKEGKAPVPFLSAWESVPYEEVVLMVAVCRKAAGVGFTDPRIVLD